jgi:hypothetical protein
VSKQKINGNESYIFGNSMKLFSPKSELKKKVPEINMR